MHPNTIRRSRIRIALSASAVAAAMTLATAGTGSAAAHPVTNVVGMKERVAVETLAANNIPFTITNRAGSLAGDCTVTDQRDRGYRTVVESDYNAEKNRIDRVERQVWKGVALGVVCR